MTPPALTRRRFTRPAWLLGGAIVATALLGTYLLFAQSGSSQRSRSTTVGPALHEIPFNGQRAYQYLQQICDLGPRPSGSPAMAAQQKLLAEHFANLGGRVTRQEFRYRHPLDGSTVPMANLLVEWHPERKERVLLCAHYDTRPFPDRDPVNPRGPFVGANDGGSGVALLMELAHEMPDFDSRYGVDFALFDGEEFVFSDTDTYFLGSEWYARQYVGNPPPYRYRWGVLFDMVADADLQLFQEGNSVSWSDTRPLVDSIWQTAARLRVPEFIPRRGQTVRDDHLKLHNIAKIPTCDIIDFDYPYWHTMEDLPRRCSAESLAKVGWVTREWLRGLK